IADPGVDLVTLQGQLPVRPEDADMDRLSYHTITAVNDKPILMLGRTGQNVTDEGRAFQDKAGVPFLQGVPEVVRALQGLVHYAAKLRHGMPETPPVAGKAADLEGAGFDDLLLGHGLTPPAGAFAASPAKASVAADKIGFPVAVKIVSAQASHKTEIGGVALNLADGAAVEDSARTMAARLKTHDPLVGITGYLVQEMVAGVEVIIGVRNDPLYGPFLLAGIGGVTVEVLKDVSIRLLPVDLDEARVMLAELRGAPLLGTFRGRPARDVDAVARAIAGLSRLFLDYRPWLAEMEINPLIVLEEGCGVRAVDVRTVRKV
ncbi:MAG TPA: acetate--CoA ligase family protein, partial [Dehalococcoidia bacterium]|nr:acetate--CoA ligase family protein [Dehalococcoidia bacterium]